MKKVLCKITIVILTVLQWIDSVLVALENRLSPKISDDGCEELWANLMYCNFGCRDRNNAEAIVEYIKKYTVCIHRNVLYRERSKNSLFVEKVENAYDLGCCIRFLMLPEYANFNMKVLNRILPQYSIPKVTAEKYIVGCKLIETWES